MSSTSVFCLHRSPPPNWVAFELRDVTGLLVARHFPLFDVFLLSAGVDSDIIDEAIYYFKANVFFKNYEIKVGEGDTHTHTPHSPESGDEVLHMSQLAPLTVTQLTCSLPEVSLSRSLTLFMFQNEADRTLIYVTLYISECLKKLQKVN